MSQSKISKIENGKALPSIVDVERILRALSAPQDLIEEISELARLANTEYQDLKADLQRGLHHVQRELAALESTCTEFRYFLPIMLTGLLQTPEYLKAAMSQIPGDHALQLALKLDRQSVLYDDSKSFTFLITESAATWALCPPLVISAQIDRLVSVSMLPNVRLGIIPKEAIVPQGPMNTFTVYDDRFATAELFSGGVAFRDPRDIQFHLHLFAYFEAYALFDEEARRMLSHWSGTFRTKNNES